LGEGEHTLAMNRIFKRLFISSIEPFDSIAKRLVKKPKSADISNFKFYMKPFLNILVESIKELSLTVKDLSSTVKQGFASIDARFREVDSRFEKLESSIDARFKAIDVRFKAIDARFDEVNANLKNIKSTLKDHGIKIHGISRGLGRSLEAYTGGWLVEMLKSRGIKYPERLIYQSYTCKKPGVGKGSKGSEIEIDLLVKDPFIVADEVTSYLDKKELPKLKRLQENREFLESCFGKQAECYFACYDISEVIKEEAEAYAAAHDITFVTEESIAKNKNKKNV
jgi:hypothetical protein